MGPSVPAMNRARLAVVILLLVAASAGATEKRRTLALLVGCTEYPNLADQRYYETFIRERGLPRARRARARAGDATFHAGWTLHRAMANDSAQRREVMTVIYFADGARVSDPVPEAARGDLEAWLCNLPPGAVAASDLNPVVWSRD